MQFRITTVDDDDLPEGQDWAMARLANQVPVCFVKRKAMDDPTILPSAWRAYDALIPARCAQ